MDSMAEIKELIQAMLQQVAIMSHHVDMLKIHNSLALARLSLLKVSSKTAPLNTNSISSPGPPPLLTISNTHQTFNTSLSPLPAPPSSPAHMVATSSTSPSTPVSPLPGSAPPKAPAFLRPSSPPSTTMTTTTTPLSMTTNPLPLTSPTSLSATVVSSMIPNLDSLEQPDPELLTDEEISYHALVDANNSKAMWPLLSIFDQPATALVYSGNTHTYLHPRTTNFLGLEIDRSTPFLVGMRSGKGSHTNKKYDAIGTYEHEQFALMLERNGKIIFEKVLFVFDPGGNIFTDAKAYESLVASILVGLSFTLEMQKKLKMVAFSGGWRLRIALAQSLFLEPDLLLRNEPMNHLILHVVLWLGICSVKWPKISIVVSYTIEFLNNETIDIIYLHGKLLICYQGDYVIFERMQEEKLRDQQKVFETSTKARERIQVLGTSRKFDIKELGSCGGVVTEHLSKNRLQMCMIPLQNPQAPRTICWNTRGSSQGIKVVILACCSRLHPDVHYLARGLDVWIHLINYVWHATANE